MTSKLRVAVVGATGYAGFELARLLLRHPHIEKPTFYLREGSAQARCLTETFSAVARMGRSSVPSALGRAIVDSGAKTVFLSTPHEASLELAPELVAAGHCAWWI